MNMKFLTFLGPGQSQAKEVIIKYNTEPNKILKILKIFFEYFK